MTHPDMSTDTAMNAWTSAYWFACGWTHAQRLPHEGGEFIPEHSSEFADHARRLRAEYNAGLAGFPHVGGSHLPSIPDMHTAFLADRA